MALLLFLRVTTPAVYFVEEGPGISFHFKDFFPPSSFFPLSPFCSSLGLGVLGEDLFFSMASAISVYKSLVRIISHPN